LRPQRGGNDAAQYILRNDAACCPSANDAEPRIAPASVRLRRLHARTWTGVSAEMFEMHTADRSLIELPSDTITMVALIFAAAFGTLAISFRPYMIPFSITDADAAAPHASLAFMFCGEGLFVLVYAAISYRVFRGKISPTSGHY
jgi:hypothetical protein